MSVISLLWRVRFIEVFGFCAMEEFCPNLELDSNANILREYAINEVGCSFYSLIKMSNKLLRPHLMY